MASQTTTSTETTTYPAGVRPEDIDTTNPFAALGVTSARVVNNSTVDIPPTVRKVLAGELAYFSGQPNTTKRELVFPSEGEADKYRAQIKSYAGEHNLNYSLPAEDKYGRKLNAGTMVTYRLTAHKK